MNPYLELVGEVLHHVEVVLGEGGRIEGLHGRLVHHGDGGELRSSACRILRATFALLTYNFQICEIRKLEMSSVFCFVSIPVFSLTLSGFEERGFQLQKLHFYSIFEHQKLRKKSIQF